MTVQQQVRDYLATQPERKRGEMQALHDMMLRFMPGCRLWFLDGKDERGRAVSNPSIGHGLLNRAYADGTTREFYQIGQSGNTYGISVYVMGLDDRTYLKTAYGATLGKATVTGCGIKLSTLQTIDLAVLETAIQDGIARAGA